MEIVAQKYGANQTFYNICNTLSIALYEVFSVCRTIGERHLVFLGLWIGAENVIPQFQLLSISKQVQVRDEAVLHVVDLSLS